MKRRAGLLALVVLAACGSAKAPKIAGSPDADARDVGSSVPDAGDADASTPEAPGAEPDALEAAPPAPLALDDVTPLAAMAGNDYALPLQARGGRPPYTWTVAMGTLPGGLALTGGTDATTQVAGKPTHAGSAAVTIQVADATGATATRAFTLLVRGRPWAFYREMGGTYMVDLARDDATPIKAPGSPLQQPGGSLDLVRLGAAPSDGGFRLDGSLQGIDLGGADVGAPVPLAAPVPDAPLQVATFPVWSRDGKRLAFEAGASDSERDLFVVDTTAGDEVPHRVNAARAAGETASQFEWAGASIVYTIYKGGVFTNYLASVDPPGAPRLLGPSQDHYGWSRSPDGTLLIYLTEEIDPGSNTVRRSYHLLGVDGHGPASPVQLDGDLFTTDGPTARFSWSADSKALEFLGVGPGGNSALLRRELDAPNAAPTVVFEGPCKGGSFTRSPDQRWLAVAGCGLWLARLGGARPLAFQQLVAAPGEDEYDVSHVAWTPDGRRLTYVASDGLEAIDTTGDAPGAAVALYAGLPGGYKTFAFAPDGSKLAVRVVAGPLQRIYLIPFSGSAPGAPVKMSADAPDGAYQYTPQFAGSWSPDGTRFAYEALVGPAFQVFAVNVDGAVPSHARRISAEGHDASCCQTPSIIQR